MKISIWPVFTFTDHYQVVPSRLHAFLLKIGYKIEDYNSTNITCTDHYQMAPSQHIHQYSNWLDSRIATIKHCSTHFCMEYPLFLEVSKEILTSNFFCCQILLCHATNRFTSQSVIEKNRFDNSAICGKEKKDIC